MRCDTTRAQRTLQQTAIVSHPMREQFVFYWNTHKLRHDNTEEFAHTKARRTSGGVSVSENTLYCKIPELRNYVWNIPIALLFDRRQRISAAATNAQRLDSLKHQYRACWTLPDVLYVIEKHHAVLFSYFEYIGGDQTAGLGLLRLHNVGLPTPEVPCFWSS